MKRIIVIGIVLSGLSGSIALAALTASNACAGSGLFDDPQARVEVAKARVAKMLPKINILGISSKLNPRADKECDQALWEYDFSASIDKTRDGHVSGAVQIYESVVLIADEASGKLKRNCEQRADFRIENGTLTGRYLVAEDFEGLLSLETLAGFAREAGVSSIAEVSIWNNGFAGMVIQFKGQTQQGQEIAKIFDPKTGKEK